MSHAKSTWFERLTRQVRVIFASPPKVEDKSTWDCTSDIPSTIQTSNWLGASVIILTSSLLKRVELSVDTCILSPSIWAKVIGMGVIHLFHTRPESHELPRIDKYLDSCLNRNQFVKILTASHSPKSVLAIRRSIGNLSQKFWTDQTLAKNSPILKIVRDLYQIPKVFLDIVTES